MPHWFYYERIRGRALKEPWVEGWPEYSDDRTRLVASFDGFSLLCLRGLAIQPISTPGFVGVIDLESAVVDISRRQAITADISGIIERVRDKVRPIIINQINRLVEGGLLVHKQPLLAKCVDLYGREAILESSLPWISLIKMPGEIELISCGQLLEIISRSRSLFISNNTDPWTAMRRWAKFEAAEGSKEPAIVLEGADFRQPSYFEGDKARVASLHELWSGCEQTALFGTVLRIAAEAWQVNLDDLLTLQEGWHLYHSDLWGRLKRP